MSFCTEYLRDFEEYSIPSPDEESELFESLKQGDSEARKKLIYGNQRLVIKIAIKYSGNDSQKLQSLIQTGNLGLIKAVQTFDLGKNVKFSTYATPCIENEIRKEMKNEDNLVSTPTRMIIKAKRCNRVISELTSTLKRKPYIEEIAEAMDTSVAKIGELLVLKVLVGS